MYDDLKVMTKSILKLYVKPSVISACKIGSDLKKIDLRKDKNFLKGKDIHLGFAKEANFKDVEEERYDNPCTDRYLSEGCSLFSYKINRKYI